MYSTPSDKFVVSATAAINSKRLMRGIVESATTSSRASLFNNTAVTTAQRPTINHSAEHVALQISPRAQCRVLPPDEFNGMILVLLPAYSVSFITTAATVSRNHAN